MKRTLTLLFMSLAAPTAAHDTTAGHLFIDHPYMPTPTATAKSAAGYMVIENRGAEPDELIEVRTDFAASTTLHTTLHEDGVAKMRHLASLPVGPGETVMLAPNGLHVMFMGLQEQVAEGDLVPATLIFRNAGEVSVDFMVDPVHGDHDMSGDKDHDTMDHGGMDHDAMDHGEMDHGTMDHSGH